MTKHRSGQPEVERRGNSQSAGNYMSSHARRKDDAGGTQHEHGSSHGQSRSDEEWAGTPNLDVRMRSRGTDPDELPPDKDQRGGDGGRHGAGNSDRSET